MANVREKQVFCQKQLETTEQIIDLKIGKCHENKPQMTPLIIIYTKRIHYLCPPIAIRTV